MFNFEGKNLKKTNLIKKKTHKFFMLELKENPKIQDFQKYVQEMEIERGFDKEHVFKRTLLLGEEVGELFKAIRKQENLKIDSNSKIGTLQEEIADIFIILISIANKYNIDMEEAFRKKEEKNNKRVWV